MKSEWKVSTIEQVCNLVTDGAHYSPPSVERGEYMVSVKDFTEYGFDFTACRKISKEDYDKLYEAGCVPQKKDILVGKDGARFFEDIILYKQEEKPALLSSIAILRVDEKQIIPAYLYYYLKSPNIKKDVRDNYGSGSAIPRIVLKDFKRMPVSYPPLPIQRKMTSILSALDDKIETNNAICRNLEEQAMAMYKSWFVDYLHHKSGDFVESDTGLIPKGWHITSMSEYFPIMTGKKNANVSTAQGKYPFFSCSQDIAWTNGFSFEGPAILVAGNGDFNIKRYSGKFEAYQRTYVLIPYNPQLTGFLYYAIAWGLSKITAGARGSVIKFITKGNIADYKVAVPDNLINLPIIAAINSLNAIIDNLKTENLRLTNLRNTLLPKLMSGKLAVENYNLPIKG